MHLTGSPECGKLEAKVCRGIFFSRSSLGSDDGGARYPASKAKSARSLLFEQNFLQFSYKFWLDLFSQGVTDAPKKSLLFYGIVPPSAFCIRTSALHASARFSWPICTIIPRCRPGMEPTCPWHSLSRRAEGCSRLSKARVRGVRIHTKIETKTATNSSSYLCRTWPFDDTII